MRHYSIGNISKSRVWASFEIKPDCGKFISFGPTYGGTVAGVVFAFGFGVIIGHIRGKHIRGKK